VRQILDPSPGADAEIFNRGGHPFAIWGLTRVRVITLIEEYQTYRGGWGQVGPHLNPPLVTVSGSWKFLSN